MSEASDMRTLRRWSRRMKRIGALTLAVCALALLSACGEPSKPPLRIASSPWPGYEPLYLAREIGYLPSDKANLYELPSADITLESFRNRSADMATLTLDETLELLHGGVKLRVIAVLDASHGADAVMAGPGVNKPSDLRGKRVAVLNIPLGAYMLSRLLETAKLQRGDINILNSAESKHEEMYRQGKADAFITFEPVKSRLAALGAHSLFDSSDIPGEILDLLVVHEDVYLQRREEVCDVVRQWFRTLAYMDSNPDAAEAEIGKRLGVTVQEYRAMQAGIKIPSMNENRLSIGGESPGIVEQAKRMNGVMQREGLIARQVDMRLALDQSPYACIARLR